MASNGHPLRRDALNGRVAPPLLPDEAELR